MKNKLIVLTFILSILIFLVVLYINSSLAFEREEIIMTLSVGDRTGIDTNTTALTFGMITEGSTASRNLVIENSYDFPIIVEFEVEGDIEKFLVYEKSIYLENFENKTISIGTMDPTGEEYGNYSGKLIVTTKRNLW